MALLALIVLIAPISLIGPVALILQTASMASMVSTTSFGPNGSSDGPLGFYGSSSTLLDPVAPMQR